MNLSHHQQHQLRRIQTGLLRADPQLTAVLGIFGRGSVAVRCLVNPVTLCGSRGVFFVDASGQIWMPADRDQQSRPVMPQRLKSGCPTRHRTI